MPVNPVQFNPQVKVLVGDRVYAIIALHRHPITFDVIPIALEHGIGELCERWKDTVIPHLTRMIVDAYFLTPDQVKHHQPVHDVDEQLDRLAKMEDVGISVGHTPRDLASVTIFIDRIWPCVRVKSYERNQYGAVEGKQTVSELVFDPSRTSLADILQPWLAAHLWEWAEIAGESSRDEDPEEMAAVEERLVYLRSERMGDVAVTRVGKREVELLLEWDSSRRHLIPGEDVGLSLRMHGLAELAAIGACEAIEQTHFPETTVVGVVTKNSMSFGRGILGVRARNVLIWVDTAGPSPHAVGSLVTITGRLEFV